jgi:hypothetical protein
MPMMAYYFAYNAGDFNFISEQTITTTLTAAVMP